MLKERSMLNANFPIIILFPIMIFSILSLQLPPPASQPPMRQLCGQELLTPPPLRIWATNLRDNKVEIYELTAEGNIQPDSKFETATSRADMLRANELSSAFTNPDLLLALSQDQISLDSFATILMFPDEDRLLLEKDGGEIYWWRVIPREESGRFVVIGYDFQLHPYLIEVEVLESDVLIGEPRQLPFRFNIDSSYTHALHVSPDGEFIGYLRPLPENRGLEYFIYSVKEDRFIWVNPYDGDGRVDVIWTPSNPNTIAMVSGMTREAASKLFAIGRDGTETLAYDFTIGFPEDVFISLGLNTWTKGGSVPFSLISLQLGEQKLVAFNPETLQLDDLCLTNVEGYFLPTSNRQFVLYEYRLDEAGRFWTIISLTTGDFYRFRLPLETQVIGVSEIMPK
jgi:hypothetical protein